ncbi:DUF418 domain-containing protein [Shewanella sp. YIC-542]|uniref:DUF418 domain-containing protein n=1 Tax=Shewanella mytili TaxID=3377111 RepID=UPI00398E5558
MLHEQAPMQAPTNHPMSASPNSNFPLLAPIARMPNIDAVRGLAVLGIFFLNIFSMGISSYDYIPSAAAPVGDTIGQVLYYLLLRDRFISLFSMLFGIGLYIQWHNFMAKGENAEAKVSARLYWLMVFGVLHGVLLWPGDILLSYGLCGLLVWRNRNLAAAELLNKSLLFIGIGVLVMLLLALLPADWPPLVRGSADYWQEYQLWTGPYPQQFQQQSWLFIMGLLAFPITYLWILSGLMLLGIYLLQQGWFSRSLPHRHRYLWGSLLLSGIACGCSFSQRSLLQSMAQVIVMIAAIPMALWLVQAIVGYCRNQPQRLSPLQAVGRIPLSLYILQSLAGVAFFRHLAPELLLTLDFMDYLLLATLWSIAQLLLAHYYLKCCRQGPLERLWRHLAYTRGNR